eukprot:2596797-Pyramimonas_sp.AAC.1
MVRIHGRLRRGIAKQWEMAHDRPYWWASPGNNCDGAVWQQRARAEWVQMMRAVHGSQDWASASIMMDLWKAFEQILRGSLIQACIVHGFPLWLAKLQVSLRRLPGV